MSLKFGSSLSMKDLYKLLFSIKGKKFFLLIDYLYLPLRIEKWLIVQYNDYNPIYRHCGWKKITLKIVKFATKGWVYPVLRSAALKRVVLVYLYMTSSNNIIEVLSGSLCGHAVVDILWVYCKIKAHIIQYHDIHMIYNDIHMIPCPMINDIMQWVVVKLFAFGPAFIKWTHCE